MYEGEERVIWVRNLIDPGGESGPFSKNSPPLNRPPGSMPRQQVNSHLYYSYNTYLAPTSIVQCRLESLKFGP